MKSANDYAREILKEFDKLEGSLNKRALFEDWLNGIFCNLNSLTGRDESGKEYEEFLERAHSTRTTKMVMGYNKITALLNEGLRTTREDILGIVYMNITGCSKSSRSFGQCFTPNSVATLMGKIVGNEDKKDKPETISDQCCGSGALSIGALEDMFRNGKKKENITLYAYDIDMICVEMALMQFSILGYDAYVIRQNLLEQDEPSIYFTPLASYKAGNNLEFHQQKTLQIIADVANKHLKSPTDAA